MASARRTGTNENVSTYGGGGRDYTSLTTWEAATDYDLVLNTTSEVLECYADSASFDDTMGASGATTNASYFRIVRPASGQGHDGTPSGFTLSATMHTSNVTILVQENYFSIQDICMTFNVSSAANQAAIQVTTGGDETSLVGLLIYDCTNPGAAAGRGIQLLSLAGPCYIVDCLVHNCDDEGIFQNAASSTAYIYNCTVTDCNEGVQQNAGTMNVINTLADNNTTVDFTGTITMSYSASSDSSASGTGSRTTQTFTFADSASDDFRLDFTDAGAKGFGTDLSADATFPFDDDVEGNTITTWSIGFDSDPVAATSGGAGFLILLRRRRR